MIQDKPLLAWLAILVLSVSVLPANSQGGEPGGKNAEASKAEYSPYAGERYSGRVYFGDTHLHSSWSTDAGMIGGTLGPETGYRVARGETVTSHLGWQVGLIRPLDFLVIADHAENLGIADFIRRSDPLCLANETCKRWHDLTKAGEGYQAFLEWLRSETGDQVNEPRMMKSAWSSATELADGYYQPGAFTTLHGFEWTSHPGGNNLHRVVIFRDGRDRTGQILPFSQFDSQDPEDLWAYLDRYEKKTGGEVLALAHNGNFSNGMMFDTRTYSGKPLTRAYAETRSRWEPLYEVTQGKASIIEPDAKRGEGVGIRGAKPELSLMNRDMGASGLAAVWAQENTRESIWDSMKRKEVYATTGSRMLVRVFAGWNFSAEDLNRPDFARLGYNRGVPMGGDLSAALAGKAPSFLVRAWRDPDGANLDRIQMIKGWLDSEGQTHERIYDVAVSDDREIGADGRSRKSVGNTVDIADANYTNSVGASLLFAHWVDPDFDPEQEAFYYVRVLEIPTPRWTAYDAKYFGIAMPGGTTMHVQDRAYTSPIWYTPES